MQCLAVVLRPLCMLMPSSHLGSPTSPAAARADRVLCGRQAGLCQVHGLLPLPLLHRAARHGWVGAAGPGRRPRHAKHSSTAGQRQAVLCTLPRVSQLPYRRCPPPLPYSQPRYHAHSLTCCGNGSSSAAEGAWPKQGHDVFIFCWCKETMLRNRCGRALALALVPSPPPNLEYSL